jgi:hypothetical protein
VIECKVVPCRVVLKETYDQHGVSLIEEIWKTP